MKTGILFLEEILHPLDMNYHYLPSFKHLWFSRRMKQYETISSMNLTGVSGFAWIDMGVSKNNGTPPQIINFNRVFHYFHHPFWWVKSTYFLVQHPYEPSTSCSSFP